MRLPNTLLLGAHKSGTTSLYYWLRQHPDVFAPRYNKDLPFFSCDTFYDYGFDWYKKIFKGCQNEKIILHGGVANLFFYTVSAPRIYSFNKDIKLIVSLRNPIERAYSAYWWARKLALEPAETFREAIAMDERRPRYAKSISNKQLHYVEYGFYYQQLRYFYKHFSKEQICVVLFDDLKERPKEVLKQLYDFLEIDTNFHPKLTVYNPFGLPRNKLIQQFLQDIRFSIPSNVRAVLYQLGLTRFRICSWNIRHCTKPPLSQEDKKILLPKYIDEIRHLETLIQRDLSHWLDISN